MKLKLVILLLLFIFHLFFRFYDLDGRTEFRWDQVDNAWAAKNILVNYKLPLVGMQAKQNSGFFIGPAYYYFIVPFYWIFDLDPVASGVIAGVTSIFTFFVLFYITKKLFSTYVALIALFIHTFSFAIITYDRFQWPVNFIAPISLIVLYMLYKSLMVNVKYLIPLALTVGFSFHINFTSVFYPIIILLTLPFIPRKRETIKYVLLSLLLSLVWFIPNIISEIQSQASPAKNMFNYLNTYYHGVHLVRILQVSSDAFVEFGILIILPILKPLKFLLFPLFGLVFIWKNFKKDRIFLFYLMTLWVIVPWFVFSTYSGEITNYYFAQTRLIAVITVSYLIYRLIQLKKIYITASLIAFFAYLTWFNVSLFAKHKVQGIGYFKEQGYIQAKESWGNEFTFGAPESYVYYYYRNKIYNEPW